ncbi:hypothetical protein NMY22_g13158 [Coprinellus aureogranulatus]|nr:hypothetical protein NMY22_g13158 [Coprinellus aureogranulatus]
MECALQRDGRVSTAIPPQGRFLLPPQAYRRAHPTDMAADVLASRSWHRVAVYGNTDEVERSHGSAQREITLYPRSCFRAFALRNELPASGKASLAL